MAQPKKITYNQYASRLKALYPDIRDLDDNVLAKRYLRANPEHRERIDPESLNELYSIGREARGGDLKFSKFQAAEMLSGMPSAIVGGIGAVTKSKTIIDYSEQLRKEQEAKSRDRILDPEIQGYLSWIEDEPVSLKNFYQGDMFQRGLAQAMPSIITLIGTDIALGVATGGVAPILTKGKLAYKGVREAGRAMRAAKKAGTPIAKADRTGAMKYASAAQKVRRAGSMAMMGAMEGSEQYNSTMEYLVGEQGVDVEQANKIASIAGLTYGAAAGVLEYIPYGRFKNVVGIGKLDGNMFERKMAQALLKNGAGAKGKIITKNMIQQSALEAGTEYSQFMTSSLVDYYVKRGYDEVPGEALQELKDAIKSPEAIESSYSGGVMGLIMGGVGGVASSSTKARLEEVRKEAREQGLSVEETEERVSKVVDEIKEESPNSAKITIGAFTTNYSGLSSEEKNVAVELSDEYRKDPKKGAQEVVEAIKDEPEIIQDMSEEERFDFYNAIQMQDPSFEADELEQLIEPQTEPEQTIEKPETEVKDSPVKDEPVVDEPPMDSPDEESAIDVNKELAKKKKKLTKEDKKDLDRVDITYEDGQFDVKVDDKKVDITKEELESLQSGIAAVNQGDSQGLDKIGLDIVNRVDEPVDEEKPIQDAPIEQVVQDEPDESSAIDVIAELNKKENITQLRKRAKEAGIEDVTKKKKAELLEELRVLDAVEEKTKAVSPEVFEDKIPLEETKEAVEQRKEESRKSIDKQTENEIKEEDISPQERKQKDSERIVVDKEEKKSIKKGDVSTEKIDTSHKIFQSRKDKDTFEYTDGQKTTLSQIAKFLDSDKGDYYVFAGYAGTGKTTIVENISNYLDSIGKKANITAPTNKAVLRLEETAKDKYNPKLSTLHQTLYTEPDEDGLWTPNVKLNPKEDVLIIDEASMVAKEEWAVIQKYVLGKGVKVILIGDGFQLPPVQADAKLMEQHSQKGSQLLNVVRQAAESSIIKLATVLRNYRVPIVPELSEGDIEILAPLEMDKLFYNDVKENIDSAMIVSSNKRRLAINFRARKEKFGVFDTTPLLEDDKLMSVSNSLFRKNGETFVVTQEMADRLSGPITIQMIPKKGMPLKTYQLYHFLDENGENQFLAPDLFEASFHFRQLTDESMYRLVEAYPSAFREDNKGRMVPQDDTNINTYAYATTAHKAQGSQWDTVYIAEGWRGMDATAARWLYTAVTRASKKLYISQAIGGHKASWAQIADAMNVTGQVNNDDVNEKLQEVSEGAKIETNKELAAKIAARLKKQFPFIKAEGVEKVYNRFGREVAGRAIDGMVQWSLTKGTLDTIPHEYAHIYVDLLRDMPIIKQGIQRFREEGDTLDRAEEKLVQYIGEYYADRIQVESLKKKVGIWLKQFWLSIKKSFANLSKDEIGSYLAEKFYQDSMEKQTITKTGVVRYQYISPNSQVYQDAYKTINNGFESFKKQLVGQGFFSKRKLRNHEEKDLIATYINKMDYNAIFEPVMQQWLSDKKFTEDTASLIQSITNDAKDFYDNFAEELNKSISSISRTDEDLRELNKSNARNLRGLGVFSEDKVQRIFAIASSPIDLQGFKETMAEGFMKKKFEDLTKKEDKLLTRYYNSAQSTKRVNRKDKRYNQQVNLIVKQKFVKDVDGKTSFEGFEISEQTNVNSFGKKNPSTERQLIAEAQGVDLSDLVVLKGTDIQMMVSDLTKNELEYKDRYNPLTVKELKFLQRDLLKQDYVLFLNRGEKEKFFFAKIQPQDKVEAKNARAYWEAKQKLEPDIYTDKVIENFLGEKRFPNASKEALQQWQAGEIARDRMTEKVFPDYLKYDGATIFKRAKIPLTPAVHSNEMPSATAKIFNKDKASFVQGDNVVNAIVTRDGKKTYILDGSSLGSLGLFKNLRKYFGMKDDSFKAKTVIHAVKEDGSFMFVKHQHFLPLQPVSIYEDYGTDKERLIATIDENGIITDDKNVPIDILMTEDEAKIVTGEFKESMDRGLEFTIPGSSFGMIKMPDKRNDSARSSQQLFNYIHDEGVLKAWKEEMIPALNRRLSKYVFAITRFDRQGNPQKKIADFFKVLYNNDKNLPDYTFKMFELGLGLHKFGRNLLEKLIQSQYVEDAMQFGQMEGLRGDTFVDYTGALDYKEVSVARNDASSIIAAYKKAKNITGTYKPTIEEVNEWLKTADYQMLITRSPVPHINGGAMVRVHSLHNQTGVVLVNEQLLFVDLEGDSDGDSVTLEKLPPNLEKEMIRMYKEIGDAKPIDLNKYVDKSKKYDLSNKEDLFELTYAITSGQNAVAEIANIQMVYGILQETLDSVTVSTRDEPYGLQLKQGNNKITDPFSKISDTIDNILRIYLQASVDNVEFLLLREWNYSKNNLLSLLFERTDGNPLTDVDIQIINKLYSKHKRVSEIKYGRDYDKGSYSLKDTIEKSRGYSKFTQDKESNMYYELSASPLFTGMNIIANFKTNEDGSYKTSIHEDIALSLGKKYDDVYIKPYHDGSPVSLHENIYYNAHIKAVNKLQDAIVEMESSEQGKRGVDYASELSYRISTLFANGSRQIDGWNTDDDMNKIINEFAGKFHDLNPTERRAATLAYFNQGMRMADSGRISLIAESGTIPPVGDSPSDLSLLDADTFKEYINFYNSAVKELIDSEIDYTLDQNKLSRTKDSIIMSGTPIPNSSINDIKRNC
tara:strand:- start:8083 stop:16110 length:8028 start_codon:yes stop_codon:yes gene_type:complete